MGSAVQILNAGAEHTRAQAQIDAARKTQASGNARRGAEAQAARTIQTIGNRRRMEATGKEVAAITENLGRSLDAATAGTFQQRIQAAEEMGSVVAGAGAAGVGGSSVDIYASTLGLQRAMQEEAQGRAVASSKYAASEDIKDTYTSGVQSIDNTAINANLDFTQYVDHKKMSGLSQLLAFTGAAAATYYGGPQAGNAVLSAFVGQNKAQNGDFAGAEQSFDTAFKGAVQGWQNFTSLGDSSQIGEAYLGKRKSSVPGSTFNFNTRPIDAADRYLGSAAGMRLL